MNLFKATALAIALALLFLAVGCQQQEAGGISEEEAKALMDDYVKIFNKKNLALIDEVFDINFELKSPVLPEPLIGTAELKNFVASTAVSFPDFHITIEDMLVDGDRIWSRFTITGTNTGRLAEIRATNKSFKIAGLAMTHVQNGKIVKDETFWNALDLYQQLGFILLPPPPID